MKRLGIAGKLDESKLGGRLVNVICMNFEVYKGVEITIYRDHCQLRCGLSVFLCRQQSVADTRLTEFP